MSDEYKGERSPVLILSWHIHILSYDFACSRSQLNSSIYIRYMCNVISSKVLGLSLLFAIHLYCSLINLRGVRQGAGGRVVFCLPGANQDVSQAGDAESGTREKRRVTW
jgi:hypothetical protein